MKSKLFKLIKTIIVSTIIAISNTSICYAQVDLNELQGYFNSVTTQKEINQCNNPKYAERNDVAEIIDPITGNLNLFQTDLYLPGRDGLDLSIARIYNSSQDECDKKVSISCTQNVYTEARTGNFIYYAEVDASGQVNYKIDGCYTDECSLQYMVNYYKSQPGYTYIKTVYETRSMEFTEKIINVTNSTDKYSYNKTRYYLGAGWSFAFPSVQIEEEAGLKYLYYHDGTGSTYMVTGTTDSGDSNLQGYQGKNVKFLEDNGSYINADNIASKYKFINEDNTIYYFASDGRLLGIKDRFSNEIKFQHQNTQIYDKTFPLINKIVDSVGRVITFSYVGNNIEVSVTAPNETNPIKITYNRIFLGKTLSCNGTVSETYQFPCLDYVTDLLGQNTYYKIYTDTNNNMPSEGFSYASSGAPYNYTWDRILLGEIDYPGSLTKYDYEKTVRYLGTNGETEAYRIKSRHDEMKRYNNSTGTVELINGNNVVNYTYSGDYTGYPSGIKEDVLPDSYQYWSEATYSNGIKEKTIFNGSKHKIQEENTASNNEKKIIKYLEFDPNYKYLPTKIEESEYSSDGSLAHNYYTALTYNSWGGLASSSVPLTSLQYNDPNIKEKYTTNYSYEDTNYKYFLTKKQWYQNDSRLLYETYHYNSDGRLDEYVNAKFEATDYNYTKDANGNIIEKIITKQIENGKTSKEKMIFGSETGYTYPNEVVSYNTNDQGVYTESRTKYTYNMFFGLIKTETDDANKITQYSYDNIGRTTVIQYPNFIDNNGKVISPKKEFIYEEAYNTDNDLCLYGTSVTSYTCYIDNSNNQPYYFEQYCNFYDVYGNLRHTMLYDNINDKYITKAKYYYDNMQRVISSEDAVQNITTQTYNEWGQIREIKDATQNTYVTNYDLKDNKIINYTVAQDNSISDYIEIYLDQFGQTTERRVYENWTDKSGALSELYQYDIVGNLVSYTDPKRNINEDGVTTSYQYDELNRTTTVKDAENQITNINYSKLGDINSISLKNNSSTTESITLYTKAYDELGNSISKTDPSNQVERYSYNNLGLNNKKVDRNGNTFTANYDGLNRLFDTNQVSSDNLSSIYHSYHYGCPFGYDNEWLYINGSYSALNVYEYNANGQISLKTAFGNDYIDSNLKLNYDDAGRLLSVGAGVGSSIFYTNYKYENGRIQNVQTNGQQADSQTDNAKYEYYSDGKLKKITYPILNDNSYLTTEYEYNSLGRMISVKNKKGSVLLSQFSYTYDANGNIITVNDGNTTKTYAYDKLNRLIVIQQENGSQTIYLYDLRGNRITESSVIFEQNMINTSFTYDLENKLKSVTNGNDTTTMSYYPDGLRARKSTGAEYTDYIYNLSGKLVAEAKNSSAVTSNYVWGPDRVLSKKDIGGDEYYYLYNGHGDVVQIVDRNGNVVNNYQYDEWVNITTSNEAVSNSFKYAGEVYDEETGLYYLRARYYDPSIGRFLNEDSYEGQVNNPLSLNLYSYCCNNPLIYNDPSGHAAMPYDDYINQSQLYRDPTLYNILKAGWKAFTGLFIGETAKNVAKSTKQNSNTNQSTNNVAAPCPAPPNPNNNKNNNKGDSDTKGKIGENGTKTSSETVGQNGKTERVDVENPNPGQRDGQIHFHDQNNKKYIYDIAKKVLVDAKTGEVAVKSVQKVLNEPWVKKAIEKGLIYLGE